MYIWERGPKSRLKDHHGPKARSTEIIGINVLFSSFPLFLFFLFPFGPAGPENFWRCAREMKRCRGRGHTAKNWDREGGMRRVKEEKKKKKSEVKVGVFFCGAKFF